MAALREEVTGEEKRSPTLNVETCQRRGGARLERANLEACTDRSHQQGPKDRHEDYIEEDRRLGCFRRWHLVSKSALVGSGALVAAGCKFPSGLSAAGRKPKPEAHRTFDHSQLGVAELSKRPHQLRVRNRNEVLCVEHADAQELNGDRRFEP